MNQKDHESIAAIAMLAAMSDGLQTEAEAKELKTVFARLGLSELDASAQQAAAGQVRAADLAQRLTDPEARQLAYEMALAICHADGSANQQELDFLVRLREGLGLSPATVREADQRAARMAQAPLTAPPVEVATGTPPSDAGLDEMILQQAMLTGALELLPDRLANVAILPLQLRMVYQIGRHYGQQLNADQIKDLAGTLGIGAAAQMMEGIVRKTLGGIAGGILGGLLGGATGVAAGAAVSFGSTYALGHVAKQYYAQGRQLSGDDLRSLFARFQDEAKALFPKVQDQIRTQAKGVNLQRLFQSPAGPV